MEEEANYNELKETLQQQIDFIKLMKDPTRLRMFFLLYAYKRLSLTQISDLLRRTKPAVSHQIEKFVKIGMIKITEQEVRGKIKANFYELVPGFLKNATIKIDPTLKIPNSLMKEIEILQIQAKKEIFQIGSNIFQQYFEYYQNLELETKKVKETYGIYLPPFSFSALPLSKKAYEFYAGEMSQLTQKVIKFVNEEEMSEESDLIERPMMLLHSILPVKDFLTYGEI